MFQNRINGLLVEPKDVDGLANAIRELLNNRELYERVARNGAEMVRQEFSILQMAERVDHLYQQILSKSPKSIKS